MVQHTMHFVLRMELKMEWNAAVLVKRKVVRQIRWVLPLESKVGKECHWMWSKKRRRGIGTLHSSQEREKHFPNLPF